MGLGMSEVVLILVIALVIFGPRKLPELGKSLGQAMNQFRKASDEFKRTWEQEVELEKVRKSDTPTLADGSGDNYDSHHGDSGYGTDPDFNYGYDTASSSSGSSSSADSASATEAASVAVPEAAAVAATTTEKKPEPHWI